MSRELEEQVTQICDRMKHALVAAVLSVPSPGEQLPSVGLQREWMTATQLAEYWQITNTKGEPVTAGIMKWAKRPLNEFPLPHSYMGDMPRFNREEVNQWAKDEAERRRVQNERSRLKLA